MYLMKFKQERCTPCQMVDQFISEELNEKVDQTVMLFDGNERNTEIALNYGVMQTPTLLLVDDNEKVVKEVFGFDPNGIQEIFKLRRKA